MAEKKRNRDKLLEQSMYDFLCFMNANLMALNSTCIMIGLIGCDKKILRCYEHKKCNECIADWLNEFPF